ncbi:unnamed protein product [Camellia sinensis]
MEDDDNNSNETDVPLVNFKSRDELIRWACQVGRRNGFVIVVQKSNGGGIRGSKPRLSLACEGTRSYKDTRKKQQA